LAVNSHGDVIKVEVSESAGEFDTRVWTYYREKDACESEQVNGLKSLAEKYR